ncbi:MAG TPA: NAD(P)H-dependent oxidoreductase subunit E [Candidatus Eremiobacteraeota bacterium]|nr:MAG: NADH-quinone oxidoreductase subunit E [bacterium ADurb.Bin363]HPZ08621.1 NAD(P)H-dependent oxidoreductase subunit E [Candidatus Eremiobacteraeota bacterium]
MLEAEKDQLKNEILHLAGAYNNHRSGLLPVLLHIQQKYRYISRYAMQEIADIFRIHPVEVYGVVSFYSFLSTEKKGKFIIYLCQTISCDMAGKRAVARQLENELNIKFGETTPDGLFTLKYTNCLGACDKGPALLVNEDLYTKVTPEGVFDIIQSYRAKFGAHVTMEI